MLDDSSEGVLFSDIIVECLRRAMVFRLELIPCTDVVTVQYCCFYVDYNPGIFFCGVGRINKNTSSLPK